MAPTGGGRTRQVGLRRIDAALDALRPMGFAEDLVRSTISELLEAYGGDEGWAFIEEASYKLVIDTILPESEESKREDTQPKLVGNFSTKDTRMDGALEHMREFGFCDQLVRETVKELLKVYGNDGWYFFESDSYKVLLDALLEKQKNGEQGEDASQDDTGSRDDIKALPAGPSPSSEPIHPSHSKLEAENATIQTNEALDSASQTIETPGTASLTNHLDGKEQSSLEEGETKDSGGSKHLGNNPTCSPPGLHTPQRVDTLPACTRRPCYGWVSSNEEQGPLHGTKAPFPKDIARFLLRMDGRRKRKTRWDVRPEDM